MTQQAKTHADIIFEQLAREIHKTINPQVHHSNWYTDKVEWTFSKGYHTINCEVALVQDILIVNWRNTFTYDQAKAAPDQYGIWQHKYEISNPQFPDNLLHDIQHTLRRTGII